MNHRFTTLCFTALLSTAALAACSGPSEAEAEDIGTAEAGIEILNDGTYSLHLQDTPRFTPVQPGADPERGRRLFGLAPDMETEDKTEAIFEGFSLALGGVVVSNQRTCFTCHRGLSTNLGLQAGPLSSVVPLTDALFTGIDGDAQGDPDGMFNLDMLGLVKYRPGRFNPTRPQSDPFRRVFFWRKSIKLVNTGLTNGLLNDGRMRAMFETDRGAVFSHTQDGDERFDDLFTLQDAADLEAFQFSNFTHPELAALRDESHPLHQTLIDDPFYTVNITTEAEQRGKKVFVKKCVSCHNTPNVFNNVSNVKALGNGERPASFPPTAPSVARTFNVGVSERNAHGLRFTEDLGNGQFAPVVMPLVKNDGTVVNLLVTFDIGLAATTGRYEDVGRFKVPQLRDLVNQAPYFHDNSANTIEEVVDYFNSDLYNDSKDGRLHPVHLNAQQRADLIAFLTIL
jgi:hypothetical protein